MWWTGIIHGQSAAVYQSTLKRLLKWGGKIEIFTKPRPGTKAQCRENRHNMNFSDIFSTDDSTQRWAMTNIMDMFIADKSGWHPKHKKQTILKRLQTMISEKDKKAARTKLLSDEFQFYSTLCYLMDKYPCPMDFKIDSRFIISDFSNIDWRSLLPHIPEKTITKEVTDHTRHLHTHLETIQHTPAIKSSHIQLDPMEVKQKPAKNSTPSLGDDQGFVNFIVQKI